MSSEDIPQTRPRQSSQVDLNPFRNQAIMSRHQSQSLSDPPHRPGIFSNAGQVSIDGANVLANARDIYSVRPSIALSVHSDTRPSTSTTHATSAFLQPPSASTDSSTRDPQNGALYYSQDVGEHDSETYARLLLPKKEGWPLWQPNPLNNLPTAYRQKGVSIGDVGVITADGEFDFFFNICLAANDPINRNSVPEGFERIDHPQNLEDVSHRLEAWLPGDHFSTNSIRVMTMSQPDNSDNDSDVETQQYQYVATGSAGALLMTPCGGSRVNLLNTAPFVAYAKRHAIDWYKHINGTRGRGVINGSVYLITGVDKTQAWGNGVYSGLPEGDSHNLVFRKSNPRVKWEAKFPYVWARPNVATTNQGPAKESSEQNAPLPDNQCIFLRGFRVALSEGLWGSIMGDVEVSPIQDTLADSLFRKSGSIPLGKSSCFGLGNIFRNTFGTHNFASEATKGMRRRVGELGSVTAISEIPSPCASLHPLDTINRHLLANNPHAPVAITHDSVWFSVLDEEVEVLPNPAELVSKVLEKYEPNLSEDGVTLRLRSKNEGIPKNKVSSSTSDAVNKSAERGYHTPNREKGEDIFVREVTERERVERERELGQAKRMRHHSAREGPEPGQRIQGHDVGEEQERGPLLTSATTSSSGRGAGKELPIESFKIDNDASDYETASETTSSYSIIDPHNEYDPTHPSDQMRGDVDDKENILTHKSGKITWASRLFRLPRGMRQKDENKPGTGEDILNSLLAILNDAWRYPGALMAIKRGEAQKILNLLQVVLDAPECTDNECRGKVIIAMQRLSKITGFYPSTYNLGVIEYDPETDWVGHGRYSDIYKTEVKYWGIVVCVKVIKSSGLQPPELDALEERFAREAILWRQLSHQNVIPFYGLCNMESRWTCLVSPWMENGAVTDFLKKKPHFDRYLLVMDITSGLQYLHFNKIVHGDLKGANILIDGSERARIADFGISSVFGLSIPHWTTQSAPASRGGSSWWRAPELIEQEGHNNSNGKSLSNTTLSDIWAWSCVCYEIYTGKRPFYEIDQLLTLMLRFIQGGVVTPSRPPEEDDAWVSWGLTGSFWDLMTRCWSRDPKERPTIDELALTLDKREDNRPDQPLDLQRVAHHSSSWWPGSTQESQDPMRSLVKIHKILYKAGLLDETGSPATDTKTFGSPDELSSGL